MFLKYPQLGLPYYIKEDSCKNIGDTIDDFIHSVSSETRYSYREICVRIEGLVCTGGITYGKACILMNQIYGYGENSKIVKEYKKGQLIKLKERIVNNYKIPSML